MLARNKMALAVLLISTLGAVTLVSGAVAQPAAAAPNAQSGNLLTNPSFEEPYILWVTPEGGGHVAQGWIPWWFNDAGPDYSVPEYDITRRMHFDYRVHSGEAAQRIFRPSVLWKAGVYQRVQVPENSTLLFSIYVHTWATSCVQVIEEGAPRDDCNPRDSSYGGENRSFLKVGIDPTGGEDWTSPNIVWSPEYNIHDNFQQISVQATAQGSWVTAYTYTTFEWPAPINDAYWDDASLVVVEGGSATSPSAPSPVSQPNFSPGVSGRVSPQPAEADGTQYHIVSAGETLDAIAYAYRVTSQSIRELNGISGDLIIVGQRLLIHGPTVTPTATLTPLPTATEIMPTPEAMAERTEIQQTGQICVALFNDTDRNGLQGTSESLLASGLFNLSGATSGSYTTNGIDEPHCFSNLPSGDYLIALGPPPGYEVTGANQVPVTISGGSVITLSFGAIPQEVSSEATGEGQAGPAGPEALRSMFVGVGIAGGVTLMTVLVGIGALFVAAHRRAEAAKTLAQGEEANASQNDLP